MSKSIRLLAITLLLGLPWLGGCASTASPKSALDSLQYAYSAAIRWGDFEGAWNLVDPQLREARPMTSLEFERYRQVQVSAYRELAARHDATIAEREIEIGVINRHTMSERSLRYSERWQYDPAARTWWLVSGLPDFWNGE